MDRGRQRGQATVEVVGVVIALAFVSLIGWQAVVAAHVWQAAHASARTAARAGLVGAPVTQAALAVLPDHLATRATIKTARDAAGATSVSVRLRIPSVWFGRSMGSVTATSRTPR